MERKPKRRRQDTIKITFVTHSKSFYLWRERNWFLIHNVKYSLDDTLSYHQIPWYKCIKVQSMKCTLMYSFHLESLAITIFCLPSLSNPPWASPNTVACSQCLGLVVKLMGHHTHTCLQWDSAHICFWAESSHKNFQKNIFRKITVTEFCLILKGVWRDLDIWSCLFLCFKYVFLKN